MPFLELSARLHINCFNAIFFFSINRGLTKERGYRGINFSKIFKTISLRKRPGL